MFGMAAKRASAKDSQTWKARRQRAEQMFAVGIPQAMIARALGVSRQCVHNWFREWRGGDSSRLRGSRRPGSGRKAKLENDQFAAVDDALRRGPEAFGFAGKRWTLWRIATVIEQVTGIRYHPSSVWRIMRALGWTLRLPPRSKPQRKGYVPRQWTAPARSPVPKS